MKAYGIMALVVSAILSLTAMAQDDPPPEEPLPGDIPPYYNPDDMELDNKYIGNWVQPNCLVGILFMLFFTSFFCFGIKLLGEIQTPVTIREKGLNWGHVEEAD